MQVKKTSAENIEELMEIRLEMLREVNGLAPDAAFDSDLVAHSWEYFLHGEQTTVFAMDGEKIAGCASISYISVMPTFDHPTGRRAHLMNIYTRAGSRIQGGAGRWAGGQTVLRGKKRMKKLTTIFVLLVLALSACTGQESRQRNGTPPMTTEEKEVYAAYVAINNAMIEKDRTVMELYFDENLTFTHMSGKKQTRKEFIGEIMDGTLNYYKIDTKDYSINMEGDTACMKVTHTLTAKVYGMSGSWTFGGENTYKKRNGIWVRVK